jgi:predicted aspartyl protease
MRRLGTLTDEDLAGVGTYRIADGSTFQVRTFRIRSLRVGDIELTNVKASLIPGKGFPLLGQSFLQHFTSWSIDNERQVLLLKEAAP